MAERILALDIGASGLKLAEFAALKSGGIELFKYGVSSLGVDPHSEGDRSTFIEATIRELVKDNGIKPGRVLISVSGQAVFSRFVKLPPVDKEKVFQIIQYEAQQNVPFPMNELVWDYQLIGGSTGELDVMLAAIKADIIEKLTDSVERAGLSPDLVDVAPMALYNAVRYNYPSLPACTLVIDMGARSTDLIFMEQGRVFSRSIPVAGNAITQQIMRELEINFEDAEQMKIAHAFVAFGGAYEGPQSATVDRVSKSVRSVMTRMHAEINRSINFYRSQQSGQQPTLVLLTGGTSVIPYTDSFFKEKLKMDVDYLNPFLNVAVSEHIQAEQIGRHAHVLGQVVGLALRRGLACPIELNLMPPKVVAQKAFRRKQPMLMAAVAGLLLVLAIWWAYYVKMNRISNERLNYVRSQVDQLEGVERQLKQAEFQVNDVKGKIDTIMELGSRRTDWVQILDQINQSLPDGMYVTQIKPVLEKRGAAAVTEENMPAEAALQAPPRIVAVEIRGVGYRDKIKSGQAVLDVRTKLRTMPLFSEKTEIQLQPTPRPDALMMEFIIKADLKKPLET